MTCFSDTSVHHAWAFLFLEVSLYKLHLDLELSGENTSFVAGAH